MSINVKNQQLVITIQEQFYSTQEGLLTIRETFINSTKAFTRIKEDLGANEKFTMFENLMLLSNFHLKGEKQWNLAFDSLLELTTQDSDLTTADKFTVYRHCELLRELAQQEFHTQSIRQFPQEKLESTDSAVAA